MTEKPQATITETATLFYNTTDQILEIIDDFDVMLLSIMHYITESFQEYYRREHGKDASETTFGTILLNDRSLKQIQEQHQPFLLQTLLARSYDAFQVYLGDLLQQIYATTLQEMTSASQETQTFMKLVIAERLARLTGAGRIDDLIKELRNNHNLPIAQTPEESKRLRELGEVRNLIVHQGGIVNERFKRRVPDTKHEIGETLATTQASVITDLKFLSAQLVLIDNHALAKHRLPSTRIYANYTDRKPHAPRRAPI